MSRTIVCLLLLILAFCLKPAVAAPSSLPDSTWFELDNQGKPIIQVYFFWSEKCPHCLNALPFITELPDEYDDIDVHSLQLVGETENIRRYQYLAMQLGQSAQSVPGIMFCNSMRTGFDAKRSPPLLLKDIDHCRQHLKRFGNLESFHFKEINQLQIELPFVGPISISKAENLPVITLLLAAVDAFNPCAFFVLIFLLSMMLHTHSRGRMLLIGGVFVFVSGLMYFLFMTAWLNLFRVIGQLNEITLIAGIVALLIGLVNVKDFFWFKQGVSLVIPDSARQTLFQRMRKLLNTRSISGVLIASIGLAMFANLYEFLCTAGFPMVFTRILTLTDMPDWMYYAYLLLYNLIYIIPLLVIVVVFAWSMGARKLQQSEGRSLKFISGVMMLSLGGILILSPDLLQDFRLSGLLLLCVMLISGLVIAIDKRLRRK